MDAPHCRSCRVTSRRPSIDIAKAVIGSPVSAYAAVFIGEAILFLVSAVVAGRIGALAKGTPRPIVEKLAAWFNTIIEIPRGSNNKYEVDKETGMIALDRVAHTAQDFPFDYGCQSGQRRKLYLLCPLSGWSKQRQHR